MEYVIKTHKGINFDIADGQIDLEEFLAIMNDSRVIAASIADVVLNKRNIKIVTPKTQLSESEATHRLSTADGEVYNVIVDDYNADAISLMINDQMTEFILLGGIILQKHNFDFLEKKRA